nr:type II secretion system protein [Victivallis vadensis]
MLVVIAIIAILASLLLPVLNKAREKSKTAKCISNHKQLGLSFLSYGNDFDDYVPVNTGVNGVNWFITLEPYYRNIAILACPASVQNGKYFWDDRFEYSIGINGWGYDMEKTISTHRFTGKRPSATMTSVDAQGDDGVGDAWAYYYIFSAWNNIAIRHENRFVNGYADGHVSTRQRLEMGEYNNENQEYQLYWLGRELF